MTRPLIISDCDEVLLHMIGPFRDWLGEQHGIDFDMSGGDFAGVGVTAIPFLIDFHSSN